MLNFHYISIHPLTNFFKKYFLLSQKFNSIKHHQRYLIEVVVHLERGECIAWHGGSMLVVVYFSHEPIVAGSMLTPRILHDFFRDKWES